MGTRHITAVMVDGEYKVAQYGQWDGYPEQAGITILEALKRCSNGLDDFKDKIRTCTFIDNDELEKRMDEVGVDKYLKDNPQMSRDLGYNIIDYILYNPPNIELFNQINFAADSLMCEYAYVIDLDSNTLEVFTGFNKTPLQEGERFFDFKAIDWDETTYYPVSCVAIFDLDKLPENDVFLKQVNEGNLKVDVQSIKSTKLKLK